MKRWLKIPGNGDIDNHHGSLAPLRPYPLPSRLIDNRLVCPCGGKNNIRTHKQVIELFKRDRLPAAARGNRPGFSYAAPPDLAKQLYESFTAKVAALGISVQNGIFGADMDVALNNDGPVTIWMDTATL